jgi:RNA polymerase subunit RPABC4/transcription elongation factor Spt4
MGNNAYKINHMRSGLCRDCSRLAVVGRKSCQVHLEHGKVRRRKEYLTRKENHLCGTCGNPQLEEDSVYVRCINCRERLTTPREWRRMLYADNPHNITGQP